LRLNCLNKRFSCLWNWLHEANYEDHSKRPHLEMNHRNLSHIRDRWKIANFPSGKFLQTLTSSCRQKRTICSTAIVVAIHQSHQGKRKASFDIFNMLDAGEIRWRRPERIARGR
jgi:hypothetical protein